MLWTIVAILLILWIIGALGGVALPALGGGGVHLLLVVVVVLVIYQLLSERRSP